MHLDFIELSFKQSSSIAKVMTKLHKVIVDNATNNGLFINHTQPVGMDFDFSSTLARTVRLVSHPEKYKITQLLQNTSFSQLLQSSELDWKLVPSQLNASQDNLHQCITFKRDRSVDKRSFNHQQKRIVELQKYQKENNLPQVEFHEQFSRNIKRLAEKHSGFEDKPHFPIFTSEKKSDGKPRQFSIFVKSHTTLLSSKQIEQQPFMFSSYGLSTGQSTTYIPIVSSTKEIA